MSHPTDQGGPPEQGWSANDRSPEQDPVALTKGGPDGQDAPRAAAEPARSWSPDATPTTDGYGQGTYEQSGYEQSGYGAATVQSTTAGGAPSPAGHPAPTNTKAIIAFCVVFAMPVLGIVFGVMARREIARTGEAGRGYATWGLGLGIAAVVLWVLYLAAVIVFVIVAGVGAAGSVADAGSTF